MALPSKEKPRWPTLAGRLANALTDRRQALRQLAASVPLSELGTAALTRLERQERSRRRRRLSNLPT